MAIKGCDCDWYACIVIHSNNKLRVTGVSIMDSRYALWVLIFYPDVHLAQVSSFSAVSIVGLARRQGMQWRC